MRAAHVALVSIAAGSTDRVAPGKLPMTSTARQTTRPTPSGARRLLWSIAALWLPAAALAQGSACDQLKATLAARIEATGVRGYSLEAVPAAAPVPAGAKAIGNCEGGERKILYRRWGGASASASASASAPLIAAEAPPKRPPPVVRPEVPAPAASVAVSKPTPAPVVTVEAAKPPPPRASEGQLARVVESVAPQAQPADPAEEKPPVSQRVSGFVATYWRWLLALLLVPLAVLGWFWRAHYLAYDKNGLPRGPRL